MKYQMKFLQMVSVLLLISLLTVLNFVNIKSHGNEVYARALRVHTIDKIQPNLALGQTAFVELALGNDTTLIKNMAPSLVVEDSISVIRDIRNKELLLLKGSDGSFNPTIQDVLYGNACKYTTGVFLVYCENLRQGAETFGLIQMVTNYEMVMDNVNELYHLAPVKSKIF